MANFVLTYSGGSGMPETPEAQQAVMEAWMGWFGSLGEAVVDGGAPFGPSAAIAADGSTSEAGVASLTGYSIITAEDLNTAIDLAKGCPILSAGGGVDVYESIPM